MKEDSVPLLKKSFCITTGIHVCEKNPECCDNVIWKDDVVEKIKEYEKHKGCWDENKRNCKYSKKFENYVLNTNGLLSFSDWLFNELFGEKL